MSFFTTSILFLAYNQVDLVDESVSACLGQQGAPLDIVLSDDASTDGTYERLSALAAAYTGPHRVTVRRNPTNVGIGEHYNLGVAACEGEFIVTAAADDISLPHRVHALVAAWQAAGCCVDLVASDLIDMSADGRDMGVIRVDDLSRWLRPEDWLAKRPFVVGASHAFTRRLFDRFGPLHPDVVYEDQVMTLRASCLGAGVTVAEPLVRYRRGGVSGRQAGGRLSAQAYAEQVRVKHSRQRSLYRQIAQDLRTLGRADLAKGRVQRQLARSELVLALGQSSAPADRWRAVSAGAGQAGWAWALVQWASSTWPGVGAALRSRRQPKA